MHFFVIQVDLTKAEISVIIQRGKWTLFYVILPKKDDDTVSWWLDCFKYLYLLPETNSDRDQLENVLDAIPQLLNTAVAKDDEETFLHVLHALLQFLGSSVAEDLAQEYSGIRQMLIQALFQFEVEYPESSDRRVAVFSCLEQKTWELPLVCRDEAYLTEVSQATLVAHCQERESIKHIHDFIGNYQYFQANVAFQANLAYLAQANSANGVQDARQIQRERSVRVFTCLSKALIALIKQDIAGLGIYISLIPNICEFIVKNELEVVETQKVYLEPILNSRESEEKKEERLTGIVKDIKDDIRRRLQTANSASASQPKEEEDRRLMQVISWISDHYLRHYDLKGSADFWGMISKKDRILRFLLHFHKYPYIHLLIQGLTLLALFIFTWLHWMPTQLPHACSLFNRRCLVVLLQYLTLLPFLLFYLPLLFMIVTIPLALLRKSMRQRWLYSQLLLPRIIGATVVGLLPLLLSTQSWFIGIQSSLVAGVLLFLFTGIGSFIYIFVEVYKTVKFIPGRSLEYALTESGKIFCIALSETLFIVTVTTTLVFPTVSRSLGDLSESTFGSIIDLGSWLSIGFFPSLILLWTGIALFIGSFVQLLWQDRPITDSV